jgi:ArsR family transcriptional regulator, arsenate/arsenite/antimonite-responsive transcriptional repressor / arsenate reductase (thioredoxin)
MAVDRLIEQRAAVHAALGEPVRLAIVEELALSDLAPSVLAAQFGLGGNLLAHHLDVLERVGLIERHVSAGDRRRRYVRLRHHQLGDLAVGSRRRGGRALFVCTHNSARSQLAAALWRQRTGHDATSAGTHPAERVHPGAVAAASRAGLELGGARPRALETGDLEVDVIVTVCDRAREQLDPPADWLHWSIPDPVEAGTKRAFDATLAELDARITDVAIHDRDPVGAGLP